MSCRASLRHPLFAFRLLVVAIRSSRPRIPTCASSSSVNRSQCMPACQSLTGSFLAAISAPLGMPFSYCANHLIRSRSGWSRMRRPSSSVSQVSPLSRRTAKTSTLSFPRISNSRCRTPSSKANMSRWPSLGAASGSGNEPDAQARSFCQRREAIVFKSREMIPFVTI